VLEWELRVQSIDAEANPREYVQRAAAWAAQYVQGVTEADLFEAHSGDADAMAALFLLCNLISKSAQLPEAFVEGLRTLWARDADVEEVKPDPWCDCPRCTKANPEAPMELCKFRGIAPNVLTCAGKLLGIDEAGAALDAPYWFVQMQAERARIRSRKAVAEEQEREKKKKGQAETMTGWDSANPNWRNTPRRSTRLV
jgi:hypothetical protein